MPEVRLFCMADLTRFQAYQDASGRISRLPSKHSRKLQLCLALLDSVRDDVDYTEKELNELFYKDVDDFAFVRRTLVDMGFLTRDSYGKAYRRTDKSPQAALVS